jgi:hypothetical protein
VLVLELDEDRTMDEAQRWQVVERLRLLAVQGTGNHGVGFQSLRIVGPAFEYIEQRAAVFCSGHAYSICDSKKRSPHSADFHNIDSQALAEKNF